MGGKLLAVLVMVALFGAACGGGESPDASAPLVEGDPADLVGTWMRATGVTWEFSDDEIVITGGVMSRVSYTADGTTLEINAVDGTCEFSGTFEWQISDDALTLAVVSDPCPGRGAALDGAVFTPQ